MLKLRWLTALSALGWLGFCVATLALPTRDDGYTMLRLGGSIVASVALLCGILLSGERTRWDASWRWAMFGCGAAAVLLPFAFHLAAPWLRSLTSLGLLALALPVGYWIGDRMEKATNLVPLAVAMSGADLYSVLQGPSREVAEKVTTYQHSLADKVAQLTPQFGAQAVTEAHRVVQAPLADYLLVHIPVAGLRTTIPLLGIGDFIILAFIFRAAWVHHLGARGVFVAALLSTLAALGVAFAVNRPVPALPFIGLGVVGYLLAVNPRMRRLDRQEIVLSVLVAAVFGALILSRYLLPGK